MKKLLLIFLLISSEGWAKTVADQCLRAKLFQDCLKAIPKAPNHTKYSDWDEVVEACAEAAYYNSLRGKDYIKPECRSDD